MSPEDREALMEQLGVDRAIRRRQAIDSATTRRQRDRTRCARRSRRHGSHADAHRRRARQALKPDDSVLDRHRFQERQAGARRNRRATALPPITIPAELAPVLDAGRAGRSCRRSSTWCVPAIPTSSIPRASCSCRASRPSSLAGLDETQATQRLSARSARSASSTSSSRSLPVRKIGVGRAQAVWLRPVQGHGVHVRAGHRRAGAVRLHRGPGRSAQRAVVRQPEPHSAPDGRSRRPRQFSRARPDQRRRAHFRPGRRRIIEARVARQMIGVRASVGMGDTRSIRVFVMGEATRPGSYTVSGLATITSALYASRRREAHRLAARHPAQARRARSCGASISTTCCCAATPATTPSCCPATSSSFRRWRPPWPSMAKSSARRSTKSSGKPRSAR